MRGTNRDADSGTRWTTTVGELVGIFRDALAAVAPILERARVHSDELRSNDDWDEIAQALFENVVVRSIRWSQEADHDIDLGRYAMLGQPSGYAPRLLVRGDRGDVWRTFHSIVSRQQPFDTVKAMDGDEQAMSEIAFEPARFALRIGKRDGLIETLTVDLQRTTLATAWASFASPR